MNPTLAPTQSDDWDKLWSAIAIANSISPGTSWRLRLLDRFLDIPRPGAGARVLEIGSGTGAFAERFVSRYPKAQYLGIDLSATGVQMSAARVPSAQFRQRDLLLPATASDNLHFGATHAICSEVLEHVDDPVCLLRNAFPYMAPGCKLVVTVPGGPMPAFARRIGHRRHFNSQDLATILNRANLDIQRATGVGFPFFNLYTTLLIWRGDKAMEDVQGKPGLLLKSASFVFDNLFRLNSLRSGWQTIGVAHYRGA